MPALVGALHSIDLSKPPDVTRGHYTGEDDRDVRAGFKTNWLNHLHLKMICELNAVETLPELLRLETQLHSLLEAAENDPKLPLPKFDLDASVVPAKPGEKEKEWRWW